MSQFTVVEWKNDHLVLLDQTKLPTEVSYLSVWTVEELWESIRTMVVRGANAIGISAAYGLYLGIKDKQFASFEDLWNEVYRVTAYLKGSRPTAVHLAHALERIRCKIESIQSSRSIEEIVKSVLAEAMLIQAEDIEMCRKIGTYGAALLKDGQGVLTHCNAGALGTTKYGTALAPLYLAHEQRLHIRVFADETRPVLQGARLTAWELTQAGLDVTLICDNMAASVMQKGWVDAVIVGADRIAANGDTANKIGTYNVAVLAREHEIPFYVAAPTNIVDFETENGESIQIEERPREEVTAGLGRDIAPEGVKVYNPAFDVTPSRYISGFITEKGIIRPPFKENFLNRMSKQLAVI